MLSDIQREILIGTMLGDGHLEQNGPGVRLRVDHGMSQRDYLRWKYQAFKNLVPSEPRVIRSFHKRDHRYDERLHFSTYSNGIFQEWRELFYKDRVKIIPESISEILTSPLSLAVWFMDDGYKRNDCNALRISTDLFTLKEQEQLVECLEENFGVQSTIHKKGKTYNIYIPQTSSAKFVELVKPYVLDSLLYKVSLTP